MIVRAGPIRRSPARRLKCAVLVVALIGIASGAAAEDPLYPAAQCSAFWLGYADYAKVSAYLDPDPAAAQAAAAFRSVARRMSGTDAEIDDFIAEQRPLMVLMMEGYIYGGDRQSREMFERLAGICQDFAKRHPETRDLK